MGLLLTTFLMHLFLVVRKLHLMSALGAVFSSVVCAAAPALHAPSRDARDDFTAS
jgi:hypothetical protein